MRCGFLAICAKIRKLKVEIMKKKRSMKKAVSSERNTRSQGKGVALDSHPKQGEKSEKWSFWPFSSRNPLSTNSFQQNRSEEFLGFPENFSGWRMGVCKYEILPNEPIFLPFFVGWFPRIPGYFHKFPGTSALSVSTCLEILRPVSTKK
jgi:hypothetical protein